MNASRKVYDEWVAGELESVAEDLQQCLMRLEALKRPLYPSKKALRVVDDAHCGISNYQAWVSAEANRLHKKLERKNND